MISCSEAVSRLWDYIERSLPADDIAAIDEHVSLCRRCCGEAEFAAELRGFLNEHSAPNVPADVRRRMDAFLSELDDPASREPLP